VSINFRLAGLLKRAQARLVEVLGPALAPLGIDGRELAVLTALSEQGPVSQQEMSRALGIDRTTMVALVDGLEGKGLVERRADPGDRRKNLLAVTSAGLRTATTAAPIVDEVERRFLAPLAAADRETLRRILGEL
jgi:DNA-binding MarR family transcriptional regulator